MDITTTFDIGEHVYDDLTRSERVVIGVSVDIGTVDGQQHSDVIEGYWVDSNYLHGGRHPWELSKLPHPA